jgi:hypothetical protein
MKKVVSVLAIMAVFSTAVFAAPLSLAGSLDTSSREVVSGIEAFGDFEDLFTDVQAVALTDNEAQAVEGEGFWFVVAIVASVLIIQQCNPPPLY